MLADILLGVFTIGVVGAIFFVVPPAEGLGEYVRIAFFHIPAAWVAVVAFFASAWKAALFLRKKDMRDDFLSARAAKLGCFFVLFATVTGAVFGKLTWGAFWNWDPRQTTIFALILIYGAYLTLRGAVANARRRAKASAVYSLLSCITVPFLVFVLPRLYFSLHPTPIINGGKMEMDSIMLIVLTLALLDATLIFFRLWLKK